MINIRETKLQYSSLFKVIFLFFFYWVFCLLLLFCLFNFVSLSRSLPSMVNEGVYNSLQNVTFCARWLTPPRRTVAVLSMLNAVNNAVIYWSVWSRIAAETMRANWRTVTYLFCGCHAVSAADRRRAAWLMYEDPSLKSYSRLEYDTFNTLNSGLICLLKP